MKSSAKKGFGFGLVSGIITTLGLMVGLHAGTHSTLAVIAGILVIAIADAFSDALGVHISEEFASLHTQKQIWISTISTFVAKMLFALTFIIPVLLFSLPTAIIVSIIWGLLLIALFSFHIAKQQNTNPAKVIIEHVGLTIMVIIVTHYIGDLVAIFCKA